MTELVYPKELRKSSGNFPYMTFRAMKYPELIQIKDDEKASSKVNTLLPEPIPSEDAEGLLGSVFRDGTDAFTANPRDGVTDIKGTLVGPTICLPISQHVANAVGVHWQMFDQFGGVQTSLEALNNWKSGKQKGLSSIYDSMQGFLVNTSLVSGLLQKTVNKLVNPKQQALFNGVEPRSFQFDFIFTPTSEDEAKTIDQIIKTFTKYSLPKISQDKLLYDFPHEWIIEFHDVQGFPELHSCVCQAVQTNYTPNALQLLKSGHSTQILFSLAFMETTLLHQDRTGIK